MEEGALEGGTSEEKGKNEDSQNASRVSWKV